jgi:gliding-associated putative ABC transporter substrate-binding component GldG
MNKFLKNTNSAATVIIVIGILIVVNFLSYQIFFRLDLTKDNNYSISKASKQAVGKLDDIVNVKVYFSNNLPNQYINLRQEVGDILDEYANYSNGKIKVEFIDPKDDQATESELYMIGIPPLQFNVLEKDKYQVVRGYLGIAVKYGDKTEAIPVVEDTKNLEYQLTLAIKKATNKINASVGLVTSNGALKTENEINQAYNELKKLYDVKLVDLTAGEIPSDINTLIIPGPKEKFSQAETKKIDDFFMSGKAILLLVDGVKVDNGLTASANDLGLDDLLLPYGVRLNKNLVLDVYSGVASFNQGFITFSTNYPFWPKVVKAGFDENTAAVSKLESVIFPWASSLEIVDGKIDPSDKISYLAKTSKDAWVEEGEFDLNPQQNFSPTSKSERTLALSISGKFKSAFGEKTTEAGRLIVVGDSDFMSDSFVRGTPDNLIFFQNLVDSLSLDEDLINIRSKGVTERPIKEISEGTKAAIRYSNIFGLTVIIVIFGLTRYYIRKRSRFVDEL